MFHAFAFAAGGALGLVLAGFYGHWKWRSLPGLRALAFYLAISLLPAAFFATCYVFKLWPWR